MEKRYAVKGSNTLYQVWGIILLIFAGIYALLNLLSLGIAIFGASYLDGILTQIYFATGKDLSGSIAAVIIICFLLFIIGMAVRIITGMLLVRDYIKSKDILIGFAVVYFLWAAFYLFETIIVIISKSTLLIMCFLLVFVWKLITGILLISKQGGAEENNGYTVTAENVSQGTAKVDGQKLFSSGETATAGQNPENVLPGQQPGYVQPVVGTIEGQFGTYQGKIFEVHRGKKYTIGRESGCDIQVKHPKVSRVHCTVCKLMNGKYQITDCSSNGTFYENVKLQKGVASEVASGGMLVLGEADNVLLLR